MEQLLVLLLSIPRYFIPSICQSCSSLNVNLHVGTFEMAHYALFSSAQWVSRSGL
jgi:hypothetical protein